MSDATPTQKRCLVPDEPRKQILRQTGAGLLPGQPTDPREVGRDNQTAVGSYASPHAFRGGRILDTDVFCLEVLRD